MKQSQAEIKAIQEKLQAIQASRSVGRAATSVATRPTADVPAMVEMTPHRTTTTATKPNTTRPQHPEYQSSEHQSSEYQPLRQRQEELAAVVAHLQQQSATYFKQPQSAKQSQSFEHLSSKQPPQSLKQSQSFKQSQPSRTQSQAAPQPVRTLPQEHPQSLAQSLKQLEIQAQRINELSSAQEAAMLEWKAIAEKLERDRQATEIEGSASNICEYLTTAVPHIERDADGLFILTARSVDLFRAEREASTMARNLRHRSTQFDVESFPQAIASPKRRTHHAPDLESWGRAAWQQISMFIDAVKASKAAPTLKTSRSRPKAAVQSVTVPDFSLQDAAMWVLGSVIVRVALDLFLVANPGMWLPVIALIAAPAAIAAYRTTVAPQSGLVWGYRLFLIMVGLLLGGRL